MPLPAEARKPTYKGLLAFARAIGEPFTESQRRIARLHFGPERRAVAIIPRGNWKTTTAAIIALHHLLTVPNAEVTVGASTRDQAKIMYERMKGFALRPALKGLVIPRTFEMRGSPYEDDLGFRHEPILKIVPGDGKAAHGYSSSLYIGDEIWAWRQEAELLEAMLTGLVKRPDAKFLGISTAATRLDSPLGRLREQALSQGDVKRRGYTTEAHGLLAWLEWSLPDDVSIENMEEVKKVNPAPNITTQILREQKLTMALPAFAQFHANRWGVSEGTWLPAGAWQRCKGDAAIEEGEDIWVAIDIGGTRANSAVLVGTADLRVQSKMWIGNDAVLEVAEYVELLNSRYRIREVAYDPFRFMSEAQRLERKGLVMVEFPQSHTRMVPASEKLFAVVTEGRLTHGDDPELNAHIAACVAVETSRGWRLDKLKGGANNDGAVALAMLVDRIKQPVQKTALLGWI